MYLQNNYGLPVCIYIIYFLEWMFYYDSLELWTLSLRKES